jgi:hypothetical protein
MFVKKQKKYPSKKALLIMMKIYEILETLSVIIMIQTIQFVRTLVPSRLI